MFRYYFLLGLRNLRRNPALTALMVLTLAVGVAASISTLTILRMMSGDPIPHKSARLVVPLLDVAGAAGYVPGTPAEAGEMAYRDAVNLLAGKQGERRSALFGMSATLEPERADLTVQASSGLAATRDFFAMFEVPLRHGQPWSEGDEARGADVVVLGRQLAEKLFGDANPVGRRVVLLGTPFQVTGVLERWAPVPRYYHVFGGSRFGREEDFVMPFRTAIRHRAETTGNISCSGDRGAGFQGLLDSDCAWIQFWFELPDGAARATLQHYLDGYTREQGRLGRMPRRNPARLFDVMQWLEQARVVSNDNRLAVWLAFGFLLLCLVNTVGLLLAKFSVRAAEVGIRRALGASRREIFRQFLIESAVVGLGGGALGLALTFLALQLIGRQSSAMAALARMDLAMLALTFALALLAAVLAGLLPTWRACQVTPALQLKSQ